MNLKLLIILAVIVFAGCRTKTVNTGDLYTIDIFKNYPPKEISLQSIADIEYVALETNNDVLLGSPCFLPYISDNYIVVWDDYFGNIHVFNRKGELVTHINHRGPGPGEYFAVTGIVFDENNKELFILDYSRIRHQIHVYSLTGEYKRTLNYSKDFEFKIYDFDDETILAYDEKGLDPTLKQTYSKKPYMFLSKKDGNINLSFVYANNLIYLKDSELTVLRHKMYFYSRLFVEKGICSNSSNQVHNEVVNRPVS